MSQTDRKSQIDESKPFQRFFLFGVMSRPAGGLGDYLGSFETYDQARAYFAAGDHIRRPYGWGQIATLHDGDLVPFANYHFTTDDWETVFQRR